MINSTRPTNQFNQMDIPTLLALRQQMMNQLAAGRSSGRPSTSPPVASAPASRPPVPPQRMAATLPPQSRLEALTAPMTLGRMLALGR